ncbi:hypothetical protein Q5Y75_19290 [Ruegeria sp. 2205SS24-7]|uniref:hypothetical protein n=1 Tax=Ruegeria discodermiae TaxID=3064389 RepID=UPI0027409872|nr:hypothetical protein [Ruegeria sp. 2205SS24-7]MDP5219368.1 hypothetical protein [Ruegeria sp. 2205SS24-7]
MAPNALSRSTGKVAARVMRIENSTASDSRQRLPDLTQSELEKLFNQAHGLEPNKNAKRDETPSSPKPSAQTLTPNQPD